MAAAALAFQERSVEEVTVADIAAAAGTSEALVYHYLPSKADLFAAAVALRLAELDERVSSAVAQLPAGTAARESTKAYLLARLDHVEQHRASWAGSLTPTAGEPESAAAIRSAARARHQDLLTALLHPAPTGRDHYALLAFLAVVDATAQEWALRGCPATERWSVVEVALGSLQGALGDWRR